MKTKLRSVFRVIGKLTPPIITDIYQCLFIPKYGWHGDYKTFEEAKKHSTGYDKAEILECVKDSILKVKYGKAVHERDSVLFNEIHYSWPLLSGLMWVVSNKDRLYIVDFGGSLGSGYFQNRKFLEGIDVRWCVVEQRNFVKAGKELIADEKLLFYESIEACIHDYPHDVIVFSSVLQYLDKPYKFIENILSYKFEYIMIDRTPLTNNKERITVQKVPPHIYEASYPCWIFNENKFFNAFIKDYEIIEKFDASDGRIGDFAFKGAILKRRS
ncbi:MAG: methyltransferase, TIGR04325 family [Nitrospinae bacterium]|nr:methyltransferase, TIGR04325 family [Nitrospinota bacterium]